MKKQLAGILVGALVFQSAFATAGASGLSQPQKSDQRKDFRFL